MTSHSTFTTSPFSCGTCSSGVDWQNDLHFQTRTTIDTLDYSGHGFNQGSKVVIAAAGPRRRELPGEPPSLRLPQGFSEPRIVLPGIMAIQARPYHDSGADIAPFCRSFAPDDPIRGFPLVVIVDDSAVRRAQSLRNFLWVTFTRSDPAADIDGIESFTEKKHWGCAGPLVIDARIKPHHAPPLVDDPEIERRVDELAAPGGPLHGVY